MNKDSRSDNAFERDKPGTNARTQAEAAIEQLRRRGGLFVEAVRATRMPMALTDPNLPGNPIVFANEALLGLSGYRMEELLGQQPHFMNGSGTDPKDAARFAEAIRSDQDDIVETVQYRKDGSRFVATVLISAFKDDQGRVLNHFMSWLDVTRRVDAETEVADLKRMQVALQESEAALREREERYRVLFNSIDEGFCIIEVLFDDAGRPVDYVFLETNPAFERQTGLVDPVGKRMRALAPDHEEHWFERYGRIVTTGEPERFEDVAAALGRWYDVFAFRIGEATERRVAILFQDILLRKRAEQALRESEERQVLLLKLTDALRPIQDAHEIQATTARMVGEHLGADRAMYAEVEGEHGSERGTIRGQYVRPAFEGDAPAPFPQHFTFGQFGQHTMAARYRGEPLIVSDVQSDPAYSAEERAAWAQFGVRAAVVATLPKGGRLVAEFGVHSAAAREWTEAEVALIQEVAERTWAAAERARAETALRESESKYRSLFESMDEGYLLAEVITDEASGETDILYIEANPAAVRIAGRDFAGQRMRDLDPDYEGFWYELYRRVAETGKPERGEHFAAPHDRWFAFYVFRVGGKETRQVACVFQDITERKREEGLLRESEEQLQAAFQSVPVGVAVINTEGKALTTNEECRRFLPTGVIPSLDAETVSRWRAWDQNGRPIDPRDWPSSRALRGEAVVPGLDMLFIADDGREIWTRVAAVPTWDRSGAVTGAVSTVTDVDVAKRSVDALQESEERLRLIVESARDYAIFTIDLDRRITSWLPGAENVFGWTPEEAIGRPVDITFTPEDRDKNEPNKEVEEARRTGSAPNVRWHVRKDGSRVFIDGHVVALRNERGEVDGFLKIGQDTTEKHRAREHERMLVAELQHRVRNTLAVIRSIVRRTANTADSVEQFEQNLDGRLGSFARTQAYVTRDFEGSMDLEMIVRDELLAHAAGDGDQVSIAGPEVRLSAKQAETISLAMHELASNAMKHGALAGEGNQVDVKWSLEGDGEERRLHLSWLETLSDRSLETPQRSGFGTELLEKVMSYELDAEPEIEFRPNGLSYRVAIPLSTGAPSR